MAERIPQSVAYLVVFRAYLSADGTTPATGKTIAITISKNGATSFSNPAAGATNATEMAHGFYKFTLGINDTDTIGPLAWRGTNADINDAGDALSITNEITDISDRLPAALSTDGLMSCNVAQIEDTDAADYLLGVEQGVWDVDTSGHTNAGTFGAQAKTEIDAVRSKTDHLPSSDIVHTSGKLWTLDGSGNAIAPASATTAIVSALTALNTITELVAVPGASPSLPQAIALLYMALRNKLIVTDTTKTVHNNAGTALASKTLSDNGTAYTEQKLA